VDEACLDWTAGQRQAIITVVSDKSIADRLLIKKGYTVLVLNAPTGYRAQLEGLALNVALFTTPADQPADLVQLFVTSAEELDARLTGLRKLLKPRGLLWITYPKGTSRIKTDINRDTIRSYVRTFGWEGVAMVSVDETWSALRLKAV
jgi:hypothetical protein